MKQLRLRRYKYSNRITTVLLKQHSGQESKASYVKRDTCPTDVLRKFRRYESINLIRLKQTAKLNQHGEAKNEKTAEAIRKAEKNSLMNLTLLVDETARDVKILNAILVVETDRIKDIFSPYRPHKEHLTTRFGLLSTTTTFLSRRHWRCPYLQNCSKAM